MVQLRDQNRRVAGDRTRSAHPAPDLAVFIATKLAAYGGRGRGDLRGHDIEDVVSVIAFRPEIVEELGTEERDLRDWVGARTRQHLLTHPDAEDALAANLPYAPMLPTLIPETGARHRALAARGEG